jgi:hypothetical protein
MNFIVLIVMILIGDAMALTQTVVGDSTVPISVTFKLLEEKNAYPPEEPIPGAEVRLVLGSTPDWQNPDAGHRFVTDSKGEAHFEMHGLIDRRTQSRNIGFTPFSLPSRTDHMLIGVELEHVFPFANNAPSKILRWLLTMDLDRFKDDQCRTVGFMSIFTQDADGKFTKPLQRQGGEDAWIVPELNNQVVWGMFYKVANFGLSALDKTTGKRTLTFAVKRLRRTATY